MPDEGFLKRWSRRKIESREGHEPEPEPLAEAPASLAPAPEAHADADLRAPAPPPDAPAAEDGADAPRLPTMDDVAALTRDSDFSGFVARGVEQAVRRSALKKLFADPHFSSMDGLDVYIDDYTKPSPLSEAALATLRHAARHLAGAAQDALAGTDAPSEAAPLQAEADLAPAAEPTPQQHPPETETR